MPGNRFYVDLEKPRRFRYDLSTLMEFREGVYDEFTSYFIENVKALPSAGTYIIKEEFRPDIYSYDIYKSTDYWQILLLYNNTVLMTDLIRGTTLSFPSQARLESVYVNAKAAEIEAESSV